MLRILWDEVDKFHPVELIGESLGKTPMEATNRVRIDCGSVGERVVVQRELDQVDAAVCLRIEAAPLQPKSPKSQPLDDAQGA
ncbi:MAG: hypothetical protein KDB69_04675 [Acidimicrobiia bacterium]|nr:hypothetical protein [Acidimicrobiia bacterium]